MKFQEKKVTKYGNSKVINTPDLEIDEVVYLIDKEMLDFIRIGKSNIIKIENYKNGKRNI